MDRLFYIIYNSYYKHGKYKNDIPPLTVFGIFCIAVLSLATTIIYNIYLFNDPWYFRNNRFPTGFTWLFGLSVVLTYFMFYYRRRYKRIYEKYKLVSKYDKLPVKVIAFCLMVLLICLPVIEAILFNRLYLDQL